MARHSLPEFADRLNEIMPLILKGFFRRQPSSLVGAVSPAQFLVMKYLGDEGESTMTALARYLDVTTAAVTGLIDRMVRERHPERLPDPDDRRITRVRLSAQGRGLLRKFTEQKRSTIIKIFSQISEHDREEYLRIVTRMRDIILAEESGA